MADAELGFGFLTQPFDKGLNISIWMVRQFIIGSVFGEGQVQFRKADEHVMKHVSGSVEAVNA
jgi:hypothetical protein